jgi:D-ribulokinase
LTVVRDSTTIRSEDGEDINRRVTAAHVVSRLDPVIPVNTKNNDATVWLGIDVGTQSVRALAISQTGEVLACESRPLLSRRNGVIHEQDPEEWWLAMAQACTSLAQSVDPSRIAALAVDGTSGTILLADRAGRPLTPGLMYDDGRAEAEAGVIRAAAAGLAAPLEYPVQPSWALAKLLWLVRERRELLPGARLMHQADFINRRLAGQEVASDWSNALKTGYQVAGRKWPTDLLRALAISEEILPAVASPGTQLATVCAEAAAVTGIAEGTPIVAGMTDGCAAQIAAGALTAGDWNSVLGTTLVLKGVVRAPVHDPSGVVYSHRLPGGLWLAGGACNAGAAVLTKYFAGRDLVCLTAQAAQREPTDLVVYALRGRGERFPFFSPEAEGFVLGEPEDEIDLFAGLLQGVGFIERLCLDYLDLLGAPVNGSIFFTGGGARNGYWCQLRADVLGRAVRLPQNQEPALGMAILAAAQGESLAKAAQQRVRIREVIEPRPERTARFRESYVRLVQELERRSWVTPELARHAATRADQLQARAN